VAVILHLHRSIGALNLALERVVSSIASRSRNGRCQQNTGRMQIIRGLSGIFEPANWRHVPLSGNQVVGR
jgi:hypothetical protein